MHKTHGRLALPADLLSLAFFLYNFYLSGLMKNQND